MRAVGDRGRKIFALVVMECVLLGLIGASLGVFIGIAAAIAISAVGIPMPPPPGANLGYTAAIRLVPSVLGGAFVVGWLAAVIASLLPAWRVSRIPVVDALRQNV